MNTTEISYLIEMAEQDSESQTIQSGKDARRELAALTARVAELKAALKDAIEALEGAQGEWQSVSVVYLPEHLIDLRMAEIGARTALLEAK
jgi:hypothetical protein